MYNAGRKAATGQRKAAAGSSWPRNSCWIWFTAHGLNKQTSLWLQCTATATGLLIGTLEPL